MSNSVVCAVIFDVLLEIVMKICAFFPCFSVCYCDCGCICLFFYHYFPLFIRFCLNKINSHLQGMFYRTIRMLDKGLKPVLVFDGKPPTLKSGEVSHNESLIVLFCIESFVEIIIILKCCYQLIHHQPLQSLLD